MLDACQRAHLEGELRRLAEQGDYPAVAGRVIEAYGPEIFGYLMATCQSETDASDAFSSFSEDLLRGVSEFRWQSSMRTWAYTLARHALCRMLRSARRRAGVPLSQAPELLDMAERVRTRTHEYLRTEVKDKFAELRRELPEDEQTLLVLRVGREMTWNEIARVMAPEHCGDDVAAKREAARQRKRFERAKAHLAELARERGLVG